MDEHSDVSLASLEARCKSNTHRLDRLEARQDNMEKLVATVEVLATKQDSVESDVREIKADVKALSSQPAKRWDADDAGDGRGGRGHRRHRRRPDRLFL